ncbi:glycosyltransferase family 8 protein, partial [Ursidibacter sp. B-7004-1]
MNILFSCDEKYAKYLCVSLYTIMRYNKNRNIYFYIFDLGISEESKSILSSISGKNNINFISIDISDFDSLPTTINYISKATYARLKMANYLPNHIDKIIYLDVDILVQGSLSELWNIELNECYIGACIDSFIEFSQSDYKRKIGLENSEYYFNAGVLLVNLVKWRKNDVFSLCEEWLLEYND